MRDSTLCLSYVGWSILNTRHRERPKGTKETRCILPMTQNERWIVRFNEAIDFMKKNHRIPSLHCIEEHNLLNWLKANRKKMNVNELKEPGISMIRELLEYGEQFKHVNHYQ